MTRPSMARPARFFFAFKWLFGPISPIFRAGWAVKILARKNRANFGLARFWPNPLLTRPARLPALSETRKLAVKPCNSPMVPSVHLTREGETFEDPETCRRLVGKPNYPTVTRPDIAHSISIVNQYMSSPTVDHWATVE